MCFDGEPADIARTAHRTARKHHKCDECFASIEPGQKYTYVTMLYEGHWDSFHICRFCEAAARWLKLVCGGYGVGGLAEELREHWDEDTLYRSHWLGRAVIGIRRGWTGFADPLPDPAPLLRSRGLAHYDRSAA